MSIMKEVKTTCLKDVKGLGAVTLERLQKAGIFEVTQLASMDLSILKEITGLAETACVRLINNARASYTFKIDSGFGLLEERKNVKYCSTGSVELDRLLAGGLEEGSLTEFYGAFGSGKSQIVFSTVATFLLLTEEKGKKVFIIDTENTFRPERINEILLHRGTTQEEASELLKRVLVFKPKSVEDQVWIITKLLEDSCLMTRELGKIELKDIRYLALDSLVSFFRAAFIGRGTLQERQQKLNHHLSEIHTLVNEHRLYGLVTNQVIANPDPYGVEMVPVGGNIVGHSTTYRIRLKRHAGGVRSAKMMDSPSHPEEEVRFKVDEAGVGDI